MERLFRYLRPFAPKIERLFPTCPRYPGFIQPVWLVLPTSKHGLPLPMREEDFDVESYELSLTPKRFNFLTNTLSSKSLETQSYCLSSVYLILSFIIDQNNIVYKDISHYI